MNFQPRAIFIGCRVTRTLLVRLIKNILHGFLQREFDAINAFDGGPPAAESTITLHKSLRSFLKAVAPKIALSLQLEKEFEAERAEAVNELVESRSFFATHRAIASLNKFRSSFSIEEVEAMVAAAEQNDQIGGILKDHDVDAFYTELGSDYFDSLSREFQLRLSDMMSDDE